MKKAISLLLALIMMSALALAGCQKTEQAQTDSQSTTAAQQASATEITAKVSGNYGSSQQLTDEDLSAAVKVIQEEVAMWEGVSLANIRYAGDEVATKENLAWMNELGNDKGYTQVCEFLTDVEVAENAPAGPWEAGKTYKDYTWWLARKDGGDWSLMTWGYN